jgi:hypothetical protein
MRPAFEVQPQVNVLGECVFDSRPGEILPRGPAVGSDHCVKAGQGYYGDDYCALKEVLLFHCKEIFTRIERLLFLFLFFNTGDCGAGNLEDRFFSAANQETGIPDVGNGPDYSTGSYNAIAGLELRNRLLELSLPFLLRPNQQHVKDGDD